MNYVKHFIIYHDDGYTKEVTVFYTGKTGFLKVYVTETYENSVIEPIKNVWLLVTQVEDTTEHCARNLHVNNMSYLDTNTK